MIAMKHPKRRGSVAVLAVLCGSWAFAAPAPGPGDQPATIRIAVAPEAVAPGGTARVTLTLEPVEGVKINRYPKVRFSVPARPGLVPAAETALGNDTPPPMDQTAGNYFDAIDPLTLELALDRGATHGTHEIEGQLVFYYCVAKSGFCAPKKTPVKIPLTVR